MEYPSKKLVRRIAPEHPEIYEDNEEVIEAFKDDERALETMEDMMLHAHFITLDNLKKDVTIRMDEIAAYEVIR